MGQIGPAKIIKIEVGKEYDVPDLIDALVKEYRTEDNQEILNNSLIELADPRQKNDEFLEIFLNKRNEPCDFWEFKNDFLPRDQSHRLTLTLLSTRLTDDDEEGFSDVDKQAGGLNDDMGNSPPNSCNSSHLTNNSRLSDHSFRRHQQSGNSVKERNDGGGRLFRDRDLNVIGHVRSGLSESSMKSISNRKLSLEGNENEEPICKKVKILPKKADGLKNKSYRSQLEKYSKKNINFSANSEPIGEVTSGQCKQNPAINSGTPVSRPISRGLLPEEKYSRKYLRKPSSKNLLSGDKNYSNNISDSATSFSPDIDNLKSAQTKRTATGTSNRLSIHEKYSRKNMQNSRLGTSNSSRKSKDFAHFEPKNVSESASLNQKLHQTIAKGKFSKEASFSAVNNSNSKIEEATSSFKKPALLNKEPFSTKGLDLKQRIEVLRSFNLNVPIIRFEELEKIEILGEGGQATVAKCLWKGAYYAVKSYGVDEHEYSIIREIAALTKVNHPNIIQIMGISLVENEYHIMTEVAEGQNLDMLLQKNGYLDREAKDNIGGQITAAVAYLHLNQKEKPPIIHRDIKPANVIVSLSRKVKLCDFGICKFDGLSDKLTSGTDIIAGTPLYLSPNQLLYRKKATIKADIWALACTLVELYSETDVWPNLSWRSSLTEQIRKKLETERMPSTTHLPWYLSNIIKQCFDWDEEKRPTAEDILRAYDQSLK